MAVTNNAVIGVSLGYIEANPDDTELLRALIVLALHGPPIARRDTTPAHVTCSTAVVTPDWQVLQVRRRPSRAWRLPGGHVDPENDGSLLGAALRNLAMKAGIEPNTVIPGDVLPIDVSAYPIEAVPALGEPEHVHYEACFLLHVEDTSVQLPVDRTVSHRWVPIGNIPGRLGAKLKFVSTRTGAFR